MVANSSDEGLLLENGDVEETMESSDSEEVGKKKLNQCEICDKSFSNRASLNKHTSKNHPESLEKDEDVEKEEGEEKGDSDEDLLQESDDIVQIDEDLGETESPNKSFDVIDIDAIKNQKSGEKRNESDDEDTPDETPAKKKAKTSPEPQSKVSIKTSPEPQSKASNDEPLDYDVIISSSDYFTNNPKQITTKCNMGLHSKNIFTLTDPIMPKGWKMREHTKPDKTIEKHYLAPDGRVLKTRIAALEYVRILKKHSSNNDEEPTSTNDQDDSDDEEESIEVIKSVTPRQTYSNDTYVRRKQKNKKDPNAPKRPMASYFLFTVEERPKVNKELPDLSITEVAKELGQRWAKLDEATKKSYQDKSEEARKQYDIDIEEYRKSDSYKEFHQKKSSRSVSYPTSRRQSTSGTRQYGVGQECPKCGKKVTSVRTHMEDMHQPPQQIPCPGCKKVFKSKNCMSSHYSRNCRNKA